MEWTELVDEKTELVDERDDAEGKETARWIEMDKNETLEAAWLLDQVWGMWKDNTDHGREGRGVQQECADPSDFGILSGDPFPIFLGGFSCFLCKRVCQLAPEQIRWCNNGRRRKAQEHLSPGQRE